MRDNTPRDPAACPPPCGEAIEKPARRPSPRACTRCRADHKKSSQAVAYLSAAERIFRKKLRREDVADLIRPALVLAKGGS